MIKTWVQKKIIEILGDEDEVVVNFVVSTLENPGDKGIDPKKMQLDLTGKILCFILCEFYESKRNYSNIIMLGNSLKVVYGMTWMRI